MKAILVTGFVAMTCFLAGCRDAAESRASQLDGIPVGSVPAQTPGEGGRVREAGQVVYDRQGVAVRVGRWSEWSPDGGIVKVGWYENGKKSGDWMVFELVGAVYDPTSHERWSDGSLAETTPLRRADPTAPAR